MHEALKTVKELVYDPCQFRLSEFKQDLESADGAACSFQLNDMAIQQRVSKITPTKTGQFVSIWKRNAHGLTAPFDISDTLDFMVILSGSDEHFGQFIFPKQVLLEQGILSQKGKGGKRGIRVYPPWDVAANQQARKSQTWQCRYFLPIQKNKACDHSLAKQLFTKLK